MEVTICRQMCCVPALSLGKREKREGQREKEIGKRKRKGQGDEEVSALKIFLSNCSFERVHESHRTTFLIQTKERKEENRRRKKEGKET